MAKIKQGILGGFSGKVAGVVGTSWKGRAVMKSRPLSVSNPRTASQQEQRGKFSDISKLASSILTTFVQPVENPISGNISGYNRFCKDNKTAFDSLGKLVAANFGCGGGVLPNVESASLVADYANQSIVASWTNSSGLPAIRLTDTIYFAVFAEDGELLGVNAASNGRTSEAIGVGGASLLQAFASGDKVLALIACVSADGREVSVFTTAMEATAA